MINKQYPLAKKPGIARNVSQMYESVNAYLWSRGMTRYEVVKNEGNRRLRKIGEVFTLDEQ